MPGAALFDMDRTLVRVDTATLYTRWQRRRGQATWRDAARVAWWLLQYGFGVIDAPKIARRVARGYAGKEEAWMIAHCERWFSECVLEHVCDAGRAAVERHREAGDVVAIVTSATPYAARPLARELGIEHVLSTELASEAGVLTGELVEPMCYGPWKIDHSRRLADRAGFSLADAVFYSDSITDLPLLEAVGTPIAVNPDARLARLAKRRRWRVEHW